MQYLTVLFLSCVTFVRTECPTSCVCSHQEQISVECVQANLMVRQYFSMFLKTHDNYSVADCTHGDGP